MIQFYFLSIVLNALAGYILFVEDEDGVLELKSGFSLNDETFKLIAGILSAGVGLLKLLSPIGEDAPVVAGDLVPALIGLLSGFILIFEYSRSRSAAFTDAERSEKIDRFFAGNKKIIGIAALIAGALHFLFPGALFL